MHQAKSGFVIRPIFYRKTNSIICNTIAQLAIFKKTGSAKTHRQRIAASLHRDNFTSRLNYSCKHTPKKIENPYFEKLKSAQEKLPNSFVSPKKRPRSKERDLGFGLGYNQSNYLPGALQAQERFIF
jgi:hypothetical protein